MADQGYVRRLSLIVLAAGLIVAGATRAADIAVTVTGLRSADGVVRLALYDKAEGFATDEAVVVGRILPSSEGAVRTVIEGLAPGRYAIAAYDDEDNDDKFDRFLLIPREGYGFSNDARPALRAPTFEEAAFELPATGVAITFAMGY